MSEQTPSYLAGHLAPVPDEIEAVDLHVEGALPTELTGRYFRNGPNPVPGEDTGHWFTGPGMIHGVRLTGESTLRLSDYRIRPVTALAGAIRLNDELRLVFDLVAWKHGCDPEGP